MSTQQLKKTLPTFAMINLPINTNYWGIVAPWHIAADAKETYIHVLLFA